MELNNKLTVSASPHVKSAETTTGIMLDVIIALIPAGIASIFVFGARALAVIAVAVICCVLAEFLSRKAMKREQTIGDLSAVVTGLLLAYNLPSNMPLWEVALGSVIAIVVVKQMFGGIGQNFVNPALLARIVLMSAFPARMSAGAFVGLNNTGWDVDGVTGATPMGLITLADGIKDGAPNLMQMFIGTTSGCLGEVSALAIREFFDNPDNMDIINRLNEYGVKMERENISLGDELAGLSICITGTLPNMSRDEATKLIESHGGKVASGVSKKTSYLLAGEAAGSKEKKAKDLGVKIISLEDLLAMIDNAINE